MTALETPQYVLERQHLQHLFDALIEQGYRVIAPTVQEGAILYDDVERVEELPAGWQDVQESGTYSLEPSGEDALFRYTVSPQSWRRFLHPPEVRLWSATRENGAFRMQESADPVPRYAFIGVRPCELNAIRIQDRIFVDGEFPDPTYKARREQAFIVAVNCGRAGNTCFCASTNSGPRADEGYDLALTEILAREQHYFVVDVGSEAGAALLAGLPHREAQGTEIFMAQRLIADTRARMGRSLNTDNLKELLYRNAEHPRWEQVAQRCLTCANCTMVCPTCFCMTVEDVTDLSGQQAERIRRWDSCFTMDFSYIHGGSVRPSTKARYRQWMMHKLASWVDQFGTLGCVGCGRCIAWCPVGIDITEEARAIREAEEARLEEMNNGNQNT